MTKGIDVIVIGCGHNGLVCAGYLAKAGLNVHCFEANNSVGGMTAPYDLGDGYETAGLATVGYPLRSSIVRDLNLREHGYQPGPAIDTISLADNGDHLVISEKEVLSNNIPEDEANRFKQLKADYREYAKKLEPIFCNKPPRLKNMDWSDKFLLGKLGWNARFGLGRESMYELLRVAGSNIYDVLNDSLSNEQLKAAIAWDAVLGSAMGPRSPGTVMTWLQRLGGELNGPLHQYCDVSTSVSTALLKAADSLGVTVHLNAEVKRILTQDSKVAGIELANGEALQAKTVVSNVDPRTTLLRLVGAPSLDAMFAHRVSQIRGQGVVAKMYFALRGQPEFPGLNDSQLKGKLLIAPTMQYIERAYNHSKYGECSEAPVIEVTLPTTHNPGLAPPGANMMAVNVAFVPYRFAGEPEREALVKKTIAKISEFCPKLESLIVKHRLLTPKDIEQRYHAVQGHWHHGELTLHQSFMMRPLYGAAQYDTPVHGLFLCGAGCHPGGNVTGLPGYNAAKRLLKTRS
ncbi:MAG: NAD(P)/FAD-dependent oxidoreductase [Pseudomonadota bacterium]